MKNFQFEENDIIQDIAYKIKDLKLKKDYFLLYLNNNEVMKVSMDDYMEFHLNKQIGLDQKTYSILKNKEILLNAYQKAISRLALKDYSTKKMKEYLSKYFLLDELQVNAIINQLEENHLLDDEKYCESMCNYYKNSDYSYLAIKNKLIGLGISEDLLNKYLVYDLKDERKKCEKLIQKYKTSIINKSKNAKKQTIMLKLSNARFDSNVIRDCMNDTIIECDQEINILKKEYARCLLKYSKKYKDYELKNKIYSSLIRKGFSIQDIKEVENGQTSKGF